MEEGGRSDHHVDGQVCVHYLPDKGFKVLPRPTNSPDLNPIQHLWDMLEKQVQSEEAPPGNLQDLKDMLLTSWCQIPEDTSRGLVESTPRWVRAVLVAQGGHTQY